MIIDNIKSLSIVLLVCVCAYQHMKLDSYRAETIKAQEQARTESIQLSDKLNNKCSVDNYHTLDIYRATILSWHV